LLDDSASSRFLHWSQGAMQRLIGWTVSFAKAYNERSTIPSK
jgi:hypothetical protein